MSVKLECRLPATLVREVEKEDPRLRAVPLLTLDPDSFPHVALLSYHELVLADGQLHFFLYLSSSSTRFLKERPRCSLIFVQDGLVYYLKGQAQPLMEIESQQLFRFRLETVLQDLPSAAEGDAGLETGLRFRLGDEIRNQKRELRQKIATLLADSSTSPL